MVSVHKKCTPSIKVYFHLRCQSVTYTYMHTYVRHMYVSMFVHTYPQKLSLNANKYQIKISKFHIISKFQLIQNFLPFLKFY